MAEGRLTDAELHVLFERLFPHGFAGADVLAETAPEGWEHSTLLACFHPPMERVFQERLQFHRNLEELRNARRERGRAGDDASRPEPMLDEVRGAYQAQPVRQDEELTELVGQCLCDLFSHNHEVTVADGRVADIGSFRGAGAFLDEYLTGNRNTWGEGDYPPFYLGTIWIAGRADLTLVYAMIFRRLKTLGADWIVHFPELGPVDLTSLHADHRLPSTNYSVSEAAVAELKAQQRRAEVQQFCADLADMNARARVKVMDRRPPAAVRAYHQVYGRDPRGWPP